jgi:ATP-dependent helicase/nuclease subunit B
MQARFLLGPAGCGKTFRCLGEIRDALRAAPDGAPLVFLAPKQATFQLERQLLADDRLPGYTRLHILSFERLAQFIFTRLRLPPPLLLSEEGRVMVLRALLAAHKDRLRVFRTASRLPAFARQLSGVLRELQQHRLAPGLIRRLAERVGSPNRLDHKLEDLALMLGVYQDWLERHQLQDANHLLDLAADALERVDDPVSFRVAGLWLDGFAQMTPQERRLLRVVSARCDAATLAFCLESEPAGDPAWHSAWSLIGRTFRQCHSDLAALKGCHVSVTILPRSPDQSRFAGNPALQHLEQSWSLPMPTADRPPPEPGGSVRVVTCANPETEAVYVARDLLRFARDGGRYREAAVLMRHMDRYHDIVRRVFTRYQIPFFLDRREPAAHHPLAELTRNALKTVAFNWRHDDLFAALKSGLVQAPEAEIDWMENKALETGLEGSQWFDLDRA